MSQQINFGWLENIEKPSYKIGRRGQQRHSGFRHEKIDIANLFLNIVSFGTCAYIRICSKIPTLHNYCHDPLLLLNKILSDL